MSLIDAEGQGITPETLSRAERNRYEHERRESSKCNDALKIEAYAYANLVKGFSECFITGDGSVGDADITVLSAFSSTFNSADLPTKPWDDVSEEQFCNTHKLFRSPWIARAVDALGYERFHSLVRQAVAATRDIVADQASYCDDDLAFLGCHERESLVHKEMLKHYRQFAEAFNPYPSSNDDYDWAAEESIKITAAAAYAVNHTATTGPRASNPSPTPRRQTGGSNDDADSASSDDHDSHVLAYHQYNQETPRFTCWTSALEVVTAVIPAAETIQKHTHYIGKLRVEWADYPANFLPDYTFQTLIRAAIEVGYTAGPGALDQALQSTVGVTSHPLWPLYNRFGLNSITLDDDLDLTTLAHQKDPGGDWHKIVVRVARGVCHAWAKDPTHGDDIVQDVTVATYIRLLQKYDPKRGSVAAYAGPWARSYLRDTLARLKILYIPHTEVKKCKTFAKRLLARHLDDAPPVGDVGRAVWEHRHRKLAENVEKYQANTGGLVVVAPSSLDAPISDAEDDSISVVDTMMGDAGDNVDAFQHEAASNAVRKCLNNTVLDDLIEKIQTVSTKTREDGASDMEYLASVALNNKRVVALIKKSIGPDGLAILREYL